MSKSRFFLLLPEYDDPNNHLTHECLKTKKIKQIDKKFIEPIERVYNFFSLEDCELQYSVDNIKAFLFPSQQRGNDRREFYFSSSNITELFFSKLTEWTPVKKKSQDVFDEASDKENLFLILNYCAFFPDKHVENKPLEISPIFDWLIENRNKKNRIFEKHEKKHGENGEGRCHNKGKYVSFLLCSKDEAQEMLYKALMSSEDRFFAFDCDRDKIIEFKRHRVVGSNCHRIFYCHGYHPDVFDQKIKGKILSRLEQLHPEKRKIIRKYLQNKIKKEK